MSVGVTMRAAVDLYRIESVAQIREKLRIGRETEDQKGRRKRRTIQDLENMN